MGIVTAEAPDAGLGLVAERFSGVLADQCTAASPSLTWTDGTFALVGRANRWAPDSAYIWLGPQTLVYVQGNVSVGDAEDGIYRSPNDGDLREVATEIVHGYMRNGTPFLQELSGSFLLLIYWAEERRLVVVTDRLASRPLFYHTSEHRVLFASDIRGILSCPDVSRDLDQRSVVEFLRLTMVLGDRTLYEDIQCVPPASVMTVSPNGCRIAPYWTMTFSETDPLPARDCVDALTATFLKAVDRIVGSTAGVGLMLSGGIDSRTIGAALDAKGKSVRALSFCESGNADVRIAQEVAASLGWEHRLLVRDPEYYAALLPEAVRASNGLYSFYHAHYLGFHEALRSMGFTSIVEGWGLDLLFSGSYMSRRIVHLPGGRRFNVLWPAPLSASEGAVTDHLLACIMLPEDEVVQQLAGPSLQSLWQEWPRQAVSYQVAGLVDRATNAYDRSDLFFAERFWKFRSYLFPLSLRYGVRQRNPMFDKDVLDLFTQIPPSLRFNSKVYRKVLWRLSPELCRVPYARTGVPLTYPRVLESLALVVLPYLRDRRSKLQRRRQRGVTGAGAAIDSYPNVDSVIRETGLRRAALSYLLESSFAERVSLRQEILQELIDRHLKGRSGYGWFLCAALSLAVWLEEWS